MDQTISDNSGSYVNIVIIVALIAIFLWLIYPCLSRVDNFSGDMRMSHIAGQRYLDDLGDLREIRQNSYDDRWDDNRQSIRNVRNIQDQYNEPVPWDTVNNAGSGFESINEYTLVGNKCSPDCCSPQWPVPFKTQKLPSDKDYVLNNYYCNDGTHNSGCLCMKEDQAQYLRSRGQNTYS